MTTINPLFCEQDILFRLREYTSSQESIIDRDVRSAIAEIERLRRRNGYLERIAQNHKDQALLLERVRKQCRHLDHPLMPGSLICAICEEISDHLDTA